MESRSPGRSLGSVTSLDDIPRGSLCVIDTNVLIYAEHGISSQAQRLLFRVARGEVTGALPQPIWGELVHKFMLAEAVEKGFISTHRPTRQLAANPQKVKRLGLYRDKIKALRTMGLGFELCTQADLLDTALLFQEKYGLMTNDSLLLAVAVRIKADALVTADENLAHTREIPTYRPTDLKTVV